MGTGTGPDRTAHRAGVPRIPALRSGVLPAHEEGPREAKKSRGRAELTGDWKKNHGGYRWVLSHGSFSFSVQRDASKRSKVSYSDANSHSLLTALQKGGKRRGTLDRNPGFT